MFTFTERAILHEDVADPNTASDLFVRYATANDLILNGSKQGKMLQVEGQSKPAWVQSFIIWDRTLSTPDEIENQPE